VFGVNAASIVKGWTIKDKIGVVAKSCEIRAIVELIKLTQVEKDSVLLMCVDCSGCFRNQDYADHVEEIGGWEGVDREKLKELKEKGIAIREACEICEQKLADVGDIFIGRVGVEEGEVLLGGITDRGEDALSLVGISLEDKEGIEKKRKEESEKIAAEAKEKKEAMPKISSIEELEEALKNCIVCKNCKDMCPVCYCKECFFDQPLGNPTGGDLLNVVELRGAVRVPVDRLFYHLTRIYHVCTTCVGCGACEDACPKEIPLTRIYPVVAKKIQDEVFQYEPGKDVEEPLPLITYKEDELEPR
jgi:formate dehydrogenase subunit beta